MILYDTVWCGMIWYDMLWCDMIWYGLIYLLTAIGLPPGGRSTVRIYTQTIHRTIQNKKYIEQHNNFQECGPCPVLASYTLVFALQPRKNREKTSVRVAASKNTYTTIHTFWNGFFLFLAHFSDTTKDNFKLTPMMWDLKFFDRYWWWSNSCGTLGHAEW
jgi:hypothetical protein